MCFPIAAKMTLQSAGSNGNSLPCRWFSGHGLPPISFVTSPGSAAQRRSHRRVQSLTADYVLHDVSAGQNKNPRTAAAIIAHRQSWQFCDGSREYLTAAEVEKLIKTARDGRYGHRDSPGRHADPDRLPACLAGDRDMRPGMVAGRIRPISFVTRPPPQEWQAIRSPLRGDELRALRELRRQFPDSGYVFATERGGLFTADAVNRLIKR
jgi:hypothetical protein